MVPAEEGRDKEKMCCSTKKPLLRERNNSVEVYHKESRIVKIEVTNQKPHSLTSLGNLIPEEFPCVI